MEPTVQLEDTTRDVGSCWECGYLLRGLPANRCPECGRGFDPNDPTTMNMGVTVGPIARWLMKPPGWPVHLLTSLAVLMSLWSAAVPWPRGSYCDALVQVLMPMSWDRATLRAVGWEMIHIESAYGRFFVAAALWLVTMLIWIARRLARGIMVERLSRHKAATFAYWRRWLVTPVVLGLTVILCRTRLPVYAGFWVSRPWMEQAVKDAKALPPRGQIKGRWLGIYPPRRGPDTWVGYSAEMGEAYVVVGANDAGFIYRDDGLPPKMREYWTSPTIRHLGGKWYLVQMNRDGREDD